MKTIKIILGIITAFVVVFLATGLLIKETSYTTQITINKPVEEVFETFSNSENIKKCHQKDFPTGYLLLSI